MKIVKDLIIIGSGNPDIIRLIEDINAEKHIYNIIGFLERNPDLIGGSVLSYPILGDDSMLVSEFSKCSVVNNVMATTEAHFRVAKRILSSHAEDLIPNLIHPSVNTKYVKFGVGNIVYECVNYGVGALIGDFNIFYPGTVIGHEAKIGSHCLFAANTIASARTTIGNRVFFGNNSIVIPTKSVCKDTFIGAGSIVIYSIKKPKAVFGNPAKMLYEIDPINDE